MKKLLIISSIFCVSTQFVHPMETVKPADCLKTLAAEPLKVALVE